MGKKYYYVKFSFMRKDAKDVRVISDAALDIEYNDNEKPLFPLMGFIRWATKQYSKIAKVETIQVNTYFEISEQDHKDFVELRKSQGL